MDTNAEENSDKVYVARAYKVTGPNKDKAWYLDSAASIHMTYQKDVFQGKLQETNTIITVADG